MCRITNHHWMCVTAFSRVHTRLLFAELLEPDRYPDIKGVHSSSWRRDTRIQSRCIVNCRLCLRDKGFYWKLKLDCDGMEGRGALAALGSTDDLLFDRFWCQRWGWLMLISNSTGLSHAECLFIDICTVVCFCRQHYFHAQWGWTFLQLEVSLFKGIAGLSERSSVAARIFQCVLSSRDVWHTAQRVGLWVGE